MSAGGEGPLAAFAGAVVEAPAWARAALASTPELLAVEVEGAQIESMAWGPRGAPGLLLMHGNGAHAGWWSPLAPLLAQGRRVAAFSWSGMGGSDWRKTYRLETFAAESMGVAQAAGLFESRVRPVFVGHSFGGFPTLYCAHRFGERLAGAITVDSPIDPPDARHEGPPARTGPNGIYPTLAAALARFRLAPPQLCEALWYVDHIARGSLKAVEGGFTWRFDPFLWREFDGFAGAEALAGGPACPMAVLWGERSRLMGPAVVAHMRRVFPAGTPFIELPDAEHHVMLDQPVAFVTALRALLTAWP